MKPAKPMPPRLERFEVYRQAFENFEQEIMIESRGLGKSGLTSKKVAAATGFHIETVKHDLAEYRRQLRITDKERFFQELGQEIKSLAAKAEKFIELEVPDDVWPLKKDTIEPPPTDTVISSVYELYKLALTIAQCSDSAPSAHLQSKWHNAHVERLKVFQELTFKHPGKHIDRHDVAKEIDKRDRARYEDLRSYYRGITAKWENDLPI